MPLISTIHYYTKSKDSVISQISEEIRPQSGQSMRTTRNPNMIHTLVMVTLSMVQGGIRRSASSALHAKSGGTPQSVNSSYFGRRLSNKNSTTTISTSIKQSLPPQCMGFSYEKSGVTPEGRILSFCFRVRFELAILQKEFNSCCISFGHNHKAKRLNMISYEFCGP